MNWTERKVEQIFSGGDEPIAPEEERYAPGTYEALGNILGDALQKNYGSMRTHSSMSLWRIAETGTPVIRVITRTRGQSGNTRYLLDITQDDLVIEQRAELYPKGGVMELLPLPEPSEVVTEATRISNNPRLSVNTEVFL